MSSTPRFRWGDFEALSYTWGDENQDGRILLNGRVEKVHKSLEAALRQTQIGMKYWTDALSINQNDTIERNTEVTRMGKLYETAWSVVMWLGEASDDSAQACDSITSIAHLDDWVLNQQYIPYVESIHGHSDWRALMNLLRRPYSSQLWIIQELAKNHHNTIFIVATEPFSGKSLENAFPSARESI